MKISLHSEFLAKFPTYATVLVVLRHVQNQSNHPNSARILQLLRNEETAARSRFGAKLTIEPPELAAWTETFKQMGLGKKYNASSKALLLRVLEGKDLPDINPLVNLYNVFSLRSLIPFGGENFANTFGDFELTFAKGDEPFWAIGADKSKPPQTGEGVWRDALGITCRAINWRQSDRTKITNETTDTYHVLDILPPWNKATAMLVANDFAETAKELLGAEYEIIYIDRESPSAELNYQPRPKETILTSLEPPSSSPTPSSQPIAPSSSSRPHQPEAKEPHVPNTTSAHHILVPGSMGKQIETALVLTLEELWTQNNFDPADFPIVVLEHPADMNHGDWSTNVAMKLAKILHQNPKQIAAQIATQVTTKLPADFIQKVEVAGSGFINFYLSSSSLINRLQQILTAKDHFGQTAIRDGMTVMIEHTQPNSHKEIHIGHLRNSMLGMAEIRLHRAIGYKVISATYGGDVGLHVARCLWGLRGVDLNEFKTLTDKVHAIQAAYIRGTQTSATDPQVEAEIKLINKAVYEKSDPEMMTLWQQTRDWSIERHKEIYARVGTYFDRYYWESEVWEKGMAVVNQYTGSIFEKSDGAVIFDGEKYGLHKRVFITSQGTPTYEAKEIGLEKLKLDEYKLDYGVIQTGMDHMDYFKVVLKVVGLIYPEMDGRFNSEHFGMVNVPSGKMSSREGNVILGEDVLDEMHRRAYAEVNKRYPEMPEDTKNQIAETIGLGATKYTLVKYDPKQDITFDPDVTLSFSGDSGPYLQYVCVRIQSILDKAQTATAAATTNLDAWTNELQPAELSLLRKLYQLPEVIIRSALEYKTNHLTNYLFELAQIFNNFYLACPVLKSDGQTLAGRLALSEATRQVLVNGLAILGIDVPEKM